MELKFNIKFTNFKIIMLRLRKVKINIIKFHNHTTNKN